MRNRSILATGRPLRRSAYSSAVLLISGRLLGVSEMVKPRRAVPGRFGRCASGEALENDDSLFLVPQ